MRRVVFTVAAVLLVLLLFAGCAPGPNTMVGRPNAEQEVAGFWVGLWQGFISPVTFIISLFNRNVSIYEIHNNGGWYNFGFLFGASAILGGGGGGAAGARRRRRG